MFETVANASMSDTLVFFKAMVLLAAVVFTVLSINGVWKSKMRGDIAEEEIIIPLVLRILVLFVVIAVLIVAV